MLYTQLFINFQPKIEVFNVLKAGVKSTIGLALLICVLISGSARASGLPEVRPQSPPDLDVQITDINGQPVKLSDFKGSPLLVNFWAIWCPPCVAELPALQHAVAPLGAQSIKVLLVSVDRGGAEKAVPFLEERGVSSPEQAFDPRGILARHLAVQVLPTTFLLSADQNFFWVFVGAFEWDTQPVQQDIQMLLAQ